MREYQSIPRAYELMILINPEINDEALTSEIDQVSALITSIGAEITAVKRDAPWGRRRLAYPIARFRDATYVVYQFKAPASRVRDMERDLKLNERVIRYLVVRLEELPAQEPEAEAEAAEQAASEQAATDASAPEAVTAEETPEPVEATEPSA